jgi:hypothetical protein
MLLGICFGIGIKIWGIVWPAALLILALLCVGLATGQVRYKAVQEVSDQERRRACLALVLFFASMAVAWCLSWLLAT